jgi:rubrerythrin
MDLARMLARCRDEQWREEDIDWSRPPRALAPDDERLVVQLFTNMAGIERLAGALFAEQARRAQDPTLRAIFETFVVDEERHARVAARLARHYDTRHLEAYRQDRHLARFRVPFLRAVGDLDDAVANAYITCGELVLDIALLRSIDDHVRDDTCAAAMTLINRDESRHIAIDYHMIDYYGGDAYEAELARRPPRGARERLRGAASLARMFLHARPFFQAMFFGPMDVVDPKGDRMREAFRHIQRIGAKPEAQRRPFGRFLKVVHEAFNHPAAGPWVGRAASRLVGVDQRYMARLDTPEATARAATRTYDELAEEALQAKDRAA